MKIKDIQEPLFILLEDALAAEQYLDKNDSQFARRSYVRSIFAYIEGSVWILKQVCLKAKPLSGVRKIHVAEYALLAEETYELKANGDPNTRTKFLRLPDNIRFLFKLINRLFNANIDIGIGTQTWDSLLEAIKIRNRITHPKNASAFKITDEDIKLCQDVCSWFNDLVNETFKEFVKSPRTK